jgi:hypothetical protein
MNKKEVGRKVEVPELAGLPGCYLYLYISTFDPTGKRVKVFPMYYFIVKHS